MHAQSDVLPEPDHRQTHLVKLSQVPDDHVPIRFEDGEREKVVEMRAEVVRVEDLPELDRVVEGELALERGQEPPEAEKEVERTGRLCAKRQRCTVSSEREAFVEPTTSPK